MARYLFHVTKVVILTNCSSLSANAICYLRASFARNQRSIIMHKVSFYEYISKLFKAECVPYRNRFTCINVLYVYVYINYLIPSVPLRNL